MSLKDLLLLLLLCTFLSMAMAVPVPIDSSEIGTSELVLASERQHPLTASSIVAFEIDSSNETQLKKKTSEVRAVTENGLKRGRKRGRISNGHGIPAKIGDTLFRSPEVMFRLKMTQQPLVTHGKPETKRRSSFSSSSSTSSSPDLEQNDDDKYAGIQLAASQIAKLAEEQRLAYIADEERHKMATKIAHSKRKLPVFAGQEYATTTASPKDLKEKSRSKMSSSLKSNTAYYMPQL